MRIHRAGVDLEADWAYPIVPPDHLCDWARRNPAAEPVIELVQRLAVHVPIGSDLVHGDYWPGNVLWLRGALAGVIDRDASGRRDAGADIAKALLDLAIHVGLDATDPFTSRYAQEHLVSEHQPFWNLREALAGFPDPGRFWLPTYELFGRTGLSPGALRNRFERYLQMCVEATGG